MSKYIIEIPDDVQYVLLNGKADNKCYTAVRPVEELEILNSDYINEHYGELQDEAYKKGFDDGKASIENGCKGCKYEDQHGYDEPCNKCLYAHASYYTSLPKEDDRIEVGDEVNWDGDCFIVTKIFQPRNMKEQCDGIDDDGSVYHDILMEDLKKTGNHYDIASILEAMRTHD